MRIPQFTADRSLHTPSVRYVALASPAFSQSSPVIAQLRIGRGGFGATDSCDGCATFSYVGCLMDCEQAGSGAGSDCTANCLARRFECDVCNLPLHHFGSASMI